MTEIAPGWYRDPAEPSTQRYWDGEGWLGDPLPIDATPPPGPPGPPPGPPGPPPGPPGPPPGPPVAATPGPPIPTPTPGSPAGGAGDRAPAGSGHDQAMPAGSRPGAGAGGGPPAPGPGYGPGSAPPGWPHGGYPHPYPRSAPPVRPHGLALASPGSRLVARLVDTLAVLLLCVVANAWFAAAWWRVAGPTLREIWRRSLAGDPATADLQLPSQAGTLLLTMFVVTTAVWFAYEVPGSANTGQTLGKRLMGIKVMRLDSDERLGFGRSWRRWSRLGMPTILWYCGGIGLLLQAIDCFFVAIDRPLYQAIHDKAAGTVVVRVRRSAPPGPTEPHLTRR